MAASPGPGPRALVDGTGRRALHRHPQPAPGWRWGVILGELADPDWDCPTTIAKVDRKLLVVCSQVRVMHTRSPPQVPFEIAATDFPNWA